jgi:soluble lytic murein transglycosylase-like protein
MRLSNGWLGARYPERMNVLRRGACLLLFAMSAVATAQQTYSDPVLRELLRKAADEAVSFPDKYDAQVWLTDMSSRLAKQVEDPEERLEILTQVHFEATRAGLPPELVLAVIDVESNFDRFAISHAGARGLMQVMPFWLEEIGRPDANLFKIDTNLRFGCTILKYYLDMEEGDLLRALGRYNGSLGRHTYPNKVLDKLRLKWFRL